MCFLFFFLPDGCFRVLLQYVIDGKSLGCSPVLLQAVGSSETRSLPPSLAITLNA